ncbi:MAG: hypothetical protein LBL85_04610 [Methanocalculaceae archaeon]|nr:hypothetical protein [Methanocalculaceae archaeon]
MLKVDISGLRHFAEYTMSVEGLLVFYGRNGAGKSSIVAAFEMLSAIAGRSLEDWTDVFGNCGALFYFGPECTREIVLCVQRGRESYRAVLVQDPKDAERLILSREQLVVQDQKDDTQLEKIEVRTGGRESIFGVPVEPDLRDVYPSCGRWTAGGLVILFRLRCGSRRQTIQADGFIRPAGIWRCVFSGLRRVCRRRFLQWRRLLHWLSRSLSGLRS